MQGQHMYDGLDFLAATDKRAFIDEVLSVAGGHTVELIHRRCRIEGRRTQATVIGVTSEWPAELNHPDIIATAGPGPWAIVRIIDADRNPHDLYYAPERLYVPPPKPGSPIKDGERLWKVIVEKRDGELCEAFLRPPIDVSDLTDSQLLDVAFDERPYTRVYNFRACNVYVKFETVEDYSAGWRVRSMAAKPRRSRAKMGPKLGPYERGRRVSLGKARAKAARELASASGTSCQGREASATTVEER